MEGLFVIVVYALIIIAVLRKVKARQNGQSRPVQPQRPVEPQRPVQPQRPVEPQRPVQPSKPAQEKHDIVAKAKENAAKQKVDTTRLELEASHGHSHEDEKKQEVHSKACDTQKPAKVSKNPNIRSNTKLDKNIDAIVPEESILGSVDDLMVKGYSGNLDFDRDFVSEALDMVSNFTINGAHTVNDDSSKMKKGA